MHTGTDVTTREIHWALCHFSVRNISINLTLWSHASLTGMNQRNNATVTRRAWLVSVIRATQLLVSVDAGLTSPVAASV